jgi:hypothetical protein
MKFNGTVPKHVNSIPWQGYRGAEKGMAIYYSTDPVSEVPIREVPEEYPTEIVPEPNYESKTFGLYGCARTKFRAAFLKSKLKYLFFMTKYAGANYEYLDQLMVTGFYRIGSTSDVSKLHVRYLDDCSCMSETTCMALRADEAHFVALEDAFILTPEVLKKWGVTARVTKQSRIQLEEEQTAELLAYLRSKENKLDLYVEETERLQPAGDSEDEEDEGAEGTDSETVVSSHSTEDDEE